MGGLHLLGILGTREGREQRRQQGAGVELGVEQRMGRCRPLDPQVSPQLLAQQAEDAAHVGQPQCDGTLQYTPLFRAALAVSYNSAIGSGIDHIFSPARVVSSGKDTTYKLFASTTTPAGRRLIPSASAYLDAADYAQRFPDQAAFDRCDAKYNAGAATSAAARAIPGCATRYYSDHPFDWAVLS